ncbi:MAG: prepilin-type N-terminal cleavage/methylation domain-containing protein, partial [Sulfurovaceae bacterium]|nr:prepilin-type N-terminal cleavage/methylation domain-containing protein [Sulfurovaceae bacterium]
MKTKKAFSLIEVIFVLVILGIVASISSQIIVQVYENYIIQKAIYKVNNQTEIVANQLVNRLTYRIAGTTISKNHQAFLNHYNNGTALPANNWLKVEDVLNGGQTYTSLEWIGYDNNSFSADAIPYWSGVANYENNASQDWFFTPASLLSEASTIISNLSHNKVNLNDRPAGVIFLEKANRYNGGNEYDPICMGLIPTDGASTT